MVTGMKAAGRMALPTGADVEDAARVLEGWAVRTPLLRNAELDRLTGGTILVKPEVLQRTGSFKFRGAYNRLSRIPKENRPQGVVAWSSGNHAQGVAAAAGLLGLPATIVMPADAPALKIANTRALGAEVVLYDRVRESREEIGGRIAQERGAIIVPPFDDPYIIAGQGTVGLEIGDQALGMGLAVEEALAPCSGGGLANGMALGLHRIFPHAKAHTVEPAGFDDFARSLETGQKQRNASASGSACDALMAPTPGDITFAIAQRELGPGFSVTDEEAFAAMRFAFQHLKLVVEPGGAVALAAVLTGKLETKGRTIAVVLSGGNVDPGLFARVLAAA